MADPVSALALLADVDKYPAQRVNVVFGDEPYLKRNAVQALVNAVASGPDAEFAVQRFSGDNVEWRDVADQLATVALFGGGRSVVVVQEADAMVSRYRESLEDYVAKPNTQGVLVLVVDSWPKNTRLFKALRTGGLQIDCKTPSVGNVTGWLETDASRRQNAQLAAGAAEQLVEILGPELGRLDQELEKLSLLSDGQITPELVRDNVGGWRAKTAWDMLDAACAGNAREALIQLERLIHAGEHPIAILGQISASLRRLAAATRIYVDSNQAAGRRIGLRAALEQAGVSRYFLGKSEGQLKQLGRDRASRLYSWLLDADLELKGASSSPERARLVLEQLMIRVAAPQDIIQGAPIYRTRQLL